MKLNDKVYEVLKWLALVCLPAFEIAIPKLFEIWDIPYGNEIGATLQVVALLIGTLIGISTISYVQEDKYNGEE